MLEKIFNSILYEISKTIVSSKDYIDNIKYISNIMKNYLDYENVFITIFNPETNKLENLGNLDLSYKKGEGVTGKVWEYGIPIIIPDISQEKFFLNKLNRNIKEKSFSFIAVPIKVSDKVVGVLAVDKRYSEKEPLSKHADFLSIVANFLGSYLKLYIDFKEEKEKIEKEKKYLESQLKAILNQSNIEGIIGKSRVIKELSETIKKIAPTPATVLLTGESGVGKEVFAKAIHYNSQRAKKPFIKLNCAAIPEDLLESELFGYEKGAFTGANATKKGKFELANGGTIFLDEIGDMPILLQAKLLRVLQEKEIERIGGNKPIKIDVRIIAATNKDLEKMVEEGTFREDLYYRLNVISIHIPPLRERKEDIPVFSYYFLDKFNKEYNRNLKFSDELLDVFLKYEWPGNIRQLQNTIERMVILTKNDTLTKEDIPADIKKQLKNLEKNENKTPVEQFSKSNIELKLPKTVEEIEKEAIVKALEETNYVIKKAAQKLGMTPRQVRYRIEKYKIPVKK
jgi:Nif-specific regulatory protein